MTQLKLSIITAALILMTNYNQFGVDAFDHDVLHHNENIQVSHGQISNTEENHTPSYPNGRFKRFETVENIEQYINGETKKLVTKRHINHNPTTESAWKNSQYFRTGRNNEFKNSYQNNAQIYNKPKSLFSGTPPSRLYLPVKILPPAEVISKNDGDDTVIRISDKIDGNSSVSRGNGGHDSHKNDLGNVLNSTPPSRLYLPVVTLPPPEVISENYGDGTITRISDTIDGNSTVQRGNGGQDSHKNNSVVTLPPPEVIPEIDAGSTITRISDMIEGNSSVLSGSGGQDSHKNDSVVTLPPPEVIPENDGRSTITRISDMIEGNSSVLSGSGSSDSSTNDSGNVPQQIPTVNITTNGNGTILSGSAGINPLKNPNITRESNKTESCGPSADNNKEHDHNEHEHTVHHYHHIVYHNLQPIPSHNFPHIDYYLQHNHPDCVKDNPTSSTSKPCSSNSENKPNCGKDNPTSSTTKPCSSHSVENQQVSQHEFYHNPSYPFYPHYSSYSHFPIFLHYSPISFPYLR